MSIEVLEIRGNEPLAELKEPWNELLARSAHDDPFLTHEWISVWSACFADPGTRTTIIARENGRLAFVLPLIESRIGHGPCSLQVLQSATNSHSFRFHFLAEADRPDILKHVMHYLRRRKSWHMLLLSYVPLYDASHQNFLQQASAAGLSGRVKPMFETAVLSINGTWQEHLAGLKKSFKKTMRRQDRRLQEFGDVRIEVLEDERDVMRALPEALNIELQSWKGDEGSAIACRPASAEFYTSLARTAAEAGWMRLSFLNVGGTRTAFEFALEYKRRFYSIKIGYDPKKYAAFSVGRRLVHESIGRCFDEQLEAYDYVGPYSAAQEHWAPATRPLGWIYLYNRRMLSKMHQGWEFGVKPRLKKVLAPIRNRGR